VYGVTLPHVGIIFGVDIGWRVPKAKWFASSSSATSSLNGVAHRGLNIGCDSMDSRRVVAPSGAMVSLMASLESGLASVEHSRDGHADCEVEVTSRVCAQGAFIIFYLGVSDGGD
jgi:hypothetical protein